MAVEAHLIKLIGERRVFQASAYPSAADGNDYAVGDICLLTSPSSGNPWAYVCTAAGNPGTWKSVGNLA